MQSGRLVCILSLLVLSVSLFSIAAFAQGGSATVNSRATDSAGLIVIGAHIQAVNVNTNEIYPGESNESGLYTIPALLPGLYRVIVDKEGFERIAKAGVELHVAATVALNFSLQVGSTTQSVTVEGGAPIVDTTTSSLGGLVNEQKMEDLPMNGRNYVESSRLQTGVTQNKNVGTLAGMGGMFFSSNGT